MQVVTGLRLSDTPKQRRHVGPKAALLGAVNQSFQRHASQYTDHGSANKNAAEPDADGDFKKHIDPNSLEVVTAKCEPALRDANPAERYQFERLGYFALDPDSTANHQIWNRVVTLRDAWAKVAKK
ncbi:MAG: hypothetical protein ACJ8LI_10460 [Chthoniobacterales bacterium]